MIKVIIMQDVSGMWRKQTDRLFLTFARPCEIARQVNINTIVYRRTWDGFVTLKVSDKVSITYLFLIKIIREISRFYHFH